MKTPDEKLGWIKDQLCRADSARRALLAAKKQSVSEHDERLRKIRDFEDALYIKRMDSQQLELLSSSDLLSPDLDQLLSAPLRGLD